MTEEEINKILKPQKNLKQLIILFIVFLIIGISCVSIVFYNKYKDDNVTSLNITETDLTGNEEEGQNVKLEFDSLPLMLMPNKNKEETYYYINDINNHKYIINLSSETFIEITDTLNLNTGKLNKPFELKGTLKIIDKELKDLVLINRDKIFKSEELTSDNLSTYLGEFYIKDSSVTNRTVTIYIISALIGVFFLILGFLYILPNIIKVKKTYKNEELISELKRELECLRDKPYEKLHIYLTKNYIIYGVEAIRFEDIIWGYILESFTYGIKTGETLMVHTKDNKKHIVGSVSGNKNNILNNILNEISTKNQNMKIGFTDENKEYIKNNFK